MATDTDIAWAAGLFEGERVHPNLVASVAGGYCGVEFEAKRELVRFCSTPCQQRDYYVRHGNVRVAERAGA